MSDISAALQAAVAQALRADAGVITAFGMNPVRILDIPEVNAVPPYLTLGPAEVSPLAAEGFDLSETAYPVHVWSLTSPPSFGEAQALSAAVRAVLPAVRVAAGGRVYAAAHERTAYLVDPADGRTVHAVVTVRFTTAPA